MDNTSEKDRINEIIEVVMKVARGDYSVQLELSDENDDIDSLAMGLNMMIDDIREKTEEIQAANQQLRASEQQLKAANQQLQAGEQQLRAANQQLTAKEQQLRAANQQLTAKEQGLRASQEALRVSWEKFMSLVETVNDWIWEVDAEGHYTYASPRVRDLLGYEPEEIIGRTPFDLMSLEEAKRVGVIFGSLVAGQKPIINLVNTNIHKDGHLVTLETSGIPFYDVEKKFKGYRGVDRDITERKNAREELMNKVNDLERANRLMVGRELQMIALKEEVNSLLEKSGQSWKYEAPKKIKGEI